MTTEAPPGVSVLICCHNGAGRLPETLAHLALQRVPEAICWEVIVVDNASTDHTLTVAEDIWKKIGPPCVGFTILEERSQGKNFAFETGFRHAKYEYVLVCDDDNWLGDAYIETAFNLMHEDRQIGVLGGCGIFEPEQPVNVAILPFTYSYVNGSQKNAAQEHWVYGAGSVCRRSLLLELKTRNWQQITPGRSGTKLICGEDVELCFIFYLKGYKIMADDRLLFKHFVPKKRQNIDYIIRLHYWQGYSYILLSSYLLLINKETSAISKWLNNHLLFLTKALILHSVKLIHQKLIKRQPIETEQRFKQYSYYGSIKAMILKRRKIIDHAHHLKILLS